ncbi:MAG: sulfatase-like hydrolase/transferase, partial [Clostridiales bacterium]|nr:sulfatase-like hydrolase/transferase [Clostridiales bacterium]
MATKKTHNKRGLNLFVYIPAAIIYMELVVRVHCFGFAIDRGLIYITLFSIPVGLVAALLGSLWTPRVNRFVTLALMLLLTVVFGTQAVYFTIFGTFFTLFSITGAGDVLGEFWLLALEGILHSAVPLLFLFIPFVLLCVFRKRLTPARRPGARLIVGVIIASIVLQLGGAVLIRKSSGAIMSDAAAYDGPFSPVLTMPRFGVLTTLRLDIENLLTDNVSDVADFEPSPSTPPPAVSDGDAPTAEPSEEPSAPPPSPVYGSNVLEINFDALMAEEDDKQLRAMHQYFSSAEPTAQNEFTGMYDGYNLVWIVAEAFSTLALDEIHTPTLSKMAGEGFVFENFYNPVWGVSTSDGEYVTSTGLLPKSGVWSYYRSAGNEMPFGFGNMFNKLGYVSHAYHNNTYTYYNRDQSYPNMGYIYKGVGNGLEVTKQWPQSDVEM